MSPPPALLTRESTGCSRSRRNADDLLFPPQPKEVRRKRLVVVGHGMVGHRFLEAIGERAGLADGKETVLGEESCAALDRVARSILPVRLDRDDSR